MNKFNLPILALALTGGVSGCGDSSNDSNTNQAIDNMISFVNEIEGSYRNQGVSRNSISNNNRAFAGCGNYYGITKEDFKDISPSTEFDNGFCASTDDVEECVFIKNNSMFNSSEEHKSLLISNQNGHLIDFDIYGALNIFELEVSVEERENNCDHTSTNTEIPTINGKYEGYLYRFNSDIRAGFSRSGKITLNCSTGACLPTDDEVIQVFSTNGLDLIPTTSSGSKYYIKTGFVIGEIEYQLLGSTSTDGNTIAGIGHPESTNIPNSSCFDGECVFLEFHKINN